MFSLVESAQGGRTMSPYNNNFRECNERGLRGEELVKQNIELFLDPNKTRVFSVKAEDFDPEKHIYFYRTQTDGKEEITYTNNANYMAGGDLNAIIHEDYGLDPAMKEELDAISPNIAERVTPHRIIIAHGAIEVKARGGMCAIKYGVEDYPSISFELKTGNDDFPRGWLWDYMFPEESTKARQAWGKTAAIKPGALINCIYTGKVGEGLPFIVYSLPHFKEVERALIEIGDERYGWHLQDWDFSTRGPEEERLVNDEAGQNFWSVSVKALRDKGVPVHISLIEPVISQVRDKCQYWLLKRRCDHLRSMADACYRFEDGRFTKI